MDGEEYLERVVISHRRRCVDDVVFCDLLFFVVCGYKSSLVAPKMALHKYTPNLVLNIARYEAISLRY